MRVSRCVDERGQGDTHHSLLCRTCFSRVVWPLFCTFHSRNLFLLTVVLVSTGCPVHGHILVVLGLLSGKCLDDADLGQLSCGETETRVSLRGKGDTVYLVLTDTGRDSGATLFVALGAAVAAETDDTPLARTLSRGGVARLAGGAHQVAVAG